MPNTGKKEHIVLIIINIKYAHKHINNKSKTAITDPMIQYRHRTVREQNTTDKVRHTQKEIKAIAVMNNNIRLIHGIHPHIQVIKEDINMHIAPRIEQMKHKVINIQFIMKKQMNTIIT